MLKTKRSIIIIARARAVFLLPVGYYLTESGNVTTEYYIYVSCMYIFVAIAAFRRHLDSTINTQ